MNQYRLVQFTDLLHSFPTLSLKIWQHPGRTYAHLLSRDYVCGGLVEILPGWSLYKLARARPEILSSIAIGHGNFVLWLFEFYQNAMGRFFSEYSWILFFFFDQLEILLMRRSNFDILSWRWCVYTVLYLHHFLLVPQKCVCNCVYGFVSVIHL